MPYSNVTIAGLINLRRHLTSIRSGTFEDNRAVAAQVLEISRELRRRRALYITAEYEPSGEGNGWATAPTDDVATLFVVRDHKLDGPTDILQDNAVEAFETRRDAEQYIDYGE